LVDLAEAGGQAAVERQLLDGFIPAVYTSRPAAPDTPAPRLRQPSQELALRSLTVLAAHLNRQSSPDLAWWELVHLIPRRTQRLIGALTFGLLLELTFGVLFVFTEGLIEGLGVTLVVGLVVGSVGLLIGLLLRFTKWGAFPAQINTTIGGRAGDLVSGLRVGFRVGLRVGLWVGLPFGLFAAALWSDNLLNTLVFGLGTWILVVVVVGLMVGLVVTFTEWLQSPIEDAPAVTPDSILRGTRAVAIMRLLVVGLGATIVFGLLYVPVIGLVVGLRVGLLNTSWGGFAIARVWLALRRRLPLRVMAFLDDAHRRGVLRQVGAAYQFRHANIFANLRPAHPPAPRDRNQALARTQTDPQHVHADQPRLATIVTVLG
jgi:hypothetical protein